MATQQPVSAQPPALKLDNIQGDILSGLPKKTETMYFFQIKDALKFRRDLVSFVPLVKSVAQVLKDRKEIDKHKKGHGQGYGHGHSVRPHLIPMVGVNISFSHIGFKTLDIDDKKLHDTAFLRGQRLDAGRSLGDKGTGTGDSFVPDWDEPFKQDIHGVIIVTGDSHATVNKTLHDIENIFGVGSNNASIIEVTSVRGDARPGNLSAHEHFGYLDGVSNPALIGFDTNPPPGPAPIRPGVIVLGHDGDPNVTDRDGWMVDGSFLVFRYLFQKVPEFDDFVERNKLKVPGLTEKENADLLGARLVGRWKSGAPLDLAPFKDDPELGADPQRNNNFQFSAELNFQKLCPFAAHVRKTLPRADLESLGFSTERNRIMRRGIQFGPEVTKKERADKKTYHGRGLVFACYQSSITNGFQFIQQSWVNNPTFPFGETTPEVPGVDPLLGSGPNRKLSGVDPNNPSFELVLDDEWVIPRGGEYFFTPSIKGLSDAIALAA